MNLRTTLALLLLCGVAWAAEPPAPTPIEAARSRHAWVWFGLEVDAARTLARSMGRNLVIAAPGGSWREDDVVVEVADGRVIWAQVTGPGGEVRSEGASVPDLIPWLGLDEAAAQAAAAEAGRPLRVVQRDDEHLPATMDYRADRINVRLRAGVVVEADKG